MLKLNARTIINDNKIESISEYSSKSQIRMIRDSENKRKIKGSYGYKSLIVMNDGYLFLCPNTPQVYFNRLNMEEYVIISPKRYAIRKDMIREIASKTNVSQKNDIRKSKEENRFYDLSSNKKTAYYIFTINNHIYATSGIWDIKQLAKGEDKT